MKRFGVKSGIFKNFYHIDCYRFKNEKDLESLDFKEIINFFSLKTDIINSLKSYSNYQIENSKRASDKILGWDIYRTMDPSDNKT